MRIFRLSSPFFQQKCVALLTNSLKQQKNNKTTLKSFFTAQTEEICARNKETSSFGERDFEREKSESEREHTTRGNRPFLLTKRRKEKREYDEW